ncbi:DNA polymerase [Methylotenera versatilis]|uniref:DNA-directed DNA polymerase n=1 Tax=Methylotenera versatilis (strain 301) TaxID=666681 RepID=D7DJC9_METV0|nr:DNA polymerase [Methylotenera versatilis]ADI30164.1 DNA-directed DNA polymerase [Methylotenera versatilis 301]
MIKERIAIFLYLKDFTEKGNDRYFIYDEALFQEISVIQLVEYGGTLITHDYWLIAPSIYKSSGSLPKAVVDLPELAKFISGKKLDKETIKEKSIKALMKPYYTDIKDLDNYFEEYYRRISFELETYQLFSHMLFSCWENMTVLAKSKGEWDRYIEVELPVFNLMTKVAVRGIKTDNKILREHKKNIDDDFFRELKKFAIEYGLFFEVPIANVLHDILSDRGYDLTEMSVDFVLEFLPMVDNFGERVIALQKLQKSRVALANITLSKTRVCPIAETHSTVTSRMYYKNPTVQNLAKRYRDIFIADNDRTLSYVDYDQFEIGIMAALSKDKKLEEIYSNTDIYKKFSLEIFGDEGKRSISKKLFLAFTYGMTHVNLLEAVKQHGGDKEVARLFFDQFAVFIEWRVGIEKLFLENGRISTLFGNNLERTGVGELSFKEKRSCVSHVVQGTGSLIFKKALLELSKDSEIEILIPMHDAVLVQHLPAYDISKIIIVFESTMNIVLGDVINSKASIESFVH